MMDVVAKTNEQADIIVFTMLLDELGRNCEVLM
jgi:hypothetical protein